jgi:hypothetical protein
MPAPLGPLLGVALGAFFAWMSGESSQRGKDAFALTSLALVSVFALLVFTPMAAYFIAFEPDWAYAYLLDGSRRLGALHSVVLLADVASVPFGFFLGLRSTKGPRLAVLTRLVGAPLLLASLYLIILLPRLGVQATYAQFHGDFGTRPVAGGPLGYALIWFGLVLAGSTAWTIHALRHLR